MKPIQAWLWNGTNGWYVTETLFNINQSVTATPVILIEDKKRSPRNGTFGYTPAKGDIEMPIKEHPDLFIRDQNVRPNSIEALKSEAPRLSEREKMVLGVSGETPMTDRQIMQSLGFSDMNAVRPRINSLIQQGLLVEGESIKCNVTGKKVRTVTKTDKCK